MSDWPRNPLGPSPIGAFSTYGEGSGVVDFLQNFGQQMQSAGSWPTANLAVFVPVVVGTHITVYQLGWQNAGTLSGNVDAGIYDKSRTKLVSTGSTAQAGANAFQLVDIADTVLPRGVYYLALAVDNLTAQFMFPGGSFQAGNYRGCGCGEQASAFPLPGTATITGINSNRVPVVFGATAGATF